MRFWDSILSGEADEHSGGDDLNNIDWSKPAEWLENLGGFPPKPSAYPAPEEVRRESRERVAKILSDWDTLHKIIERHEERIQKRWHQKTKTHG